MNVRKLPRCHIRHIVYFCPSKQATRPSLLLDLEMANCLCACTTNSLKIPAQHAKYVAKQRVQNDFHKNLPSASINNIGIRMGKWLGLFRSEAKLSQMELHIKTQKPQKVSTQHIVTY